MSCSIKILQGNNIELLKQYSDNYFDSVVTDCPYGLGKEPNAIKLLQDWIDHGYHEIKGKGFMGKEWDAFVPQPLFWKEVFRVLKPGGHVLAFFGTRTYDWGTLAIRLAGFEIRDMICWHYGSGFPKSLDISKQLDKMAGADRRVVGTKKTGADQKKSNEKMRFSKKTFVDEGGSVVFNITAPATAPATAYEGYGTALKPATEPICVARKPTEGTVAENVLKYGTGGINLDGCRIGEDIVGWGGNGSIGFSGGLESDELGGRPVCGRFPANVIFDPFMANELDSQTGVLTSGKPCGTRKATNNIYGHYEPGQEITGFGDNGGASRFFYCAKASQEERSLGCELIEAQKTNDGRSIEADNAFQRGKNERNNFHPTVKPLALMRYLQRLVTPKGGKTLDPFAGSGTSGCSAQFEEIGECVLMEREQAYIPIIEARTKYWGSERNRFNYLENIKPVKEEIIENQQLLF